MFYQTPPFFGNFIYTYAKVISQMKWIMILNLGHTGQYIMKLEVQLFINANKHSIKLFMEYIVHACKPYKTWYTVLKNSKRED